MTDLPPVWLLDVDGVVNAPTAPKRKPPLHVWPAEEWVDTHAHDSTGHRWRIVAARPVLAFISAVHEQGRAEIRWHTTWQDAANNLGRIGLPELAVQEAPEFDEPQWPRARSWWKLPAVWRVLGEGRRVLWTDDDADTELTGEQKEQLAAAGCHIVSPDPYTGLTPKHLTAIDEWLGSS